MVSFGGTGTGSLGTAPAESDDCRAATLKRWVAGGEEVGSSEDRHPTAQKKDDAARSARTVGQGTRRGQRRLTWQPPRLRSCRRACAGTTTASTTNTSASFA